MRCVNFCSNQFFVSLRSSIELVARRSLLWAHEASTHQTQTFRAGQHEEGETSRTTSHPCECSIVFPTALLSLFLHITTRWSSAPKT